MVLVVFGLQIYMFRFVFFRVSPPTELITFHLLDQNPPTEPILFHFLDQNPPTDPIICMS